VVVALLADGVLAADDDSCPACVSASAGGREHPIDAIVAAPRSVNAVKRVRQTRKAMSSGSKMRAWVERHASRRTG
jgi:hypothetical protein